ncbi:hypothetical protein [Martelella endophytica]|uniref:hypothetical protein n=1 Tax=Martelella endophytica TaxID=1486262 RepID=UPI000A725031|nr:hypothetical protein [Martelella endophytica]
MSDPINRFNQTSDFSRFLPAAAPLPMPEQRLERARRRYGVLSIILSPVLAWQRPRSMRF